MKDVYLESRYLIPCHYVQPKLECPKLQAIPINMRALPCPNLHVSFFTQSNSLSRFLNKLTSFQKSNTTSSRQEYFTDFSFLKNILFSVQNKVKNKYTDSIVEVALLITVSYFRTLF
jgi:hypothetical protein